MNPSEIQYITRELQSLKDKPKCFVNGESYKSLLMKIDISTTDELNIDLAPLFYEYGNYLLDQIENVAYKNIFIPKST